MRTDHRCPLFPLALGALCLVAACQNGNNIVSSGGGGAAGGGGAPDGAPPRLPGLPPGGGGSFWPDAGPTPDAPPPGSAPAEMCAGNSFRAQRVPLDLLLLVDRSGSMGSVAANNKTKWEMADDAVTAFVSDPQSSGLSVGLQLFPPDTPCMTDADCGLPAPFDLKGFACVQRGVCVGPQGPIVPTVSCGGMLSEQCSAGVTCTPLGRCSASAAPCTSVGQPCPGGTAGDTCQPLGKACTLHIGLDSCMPGDYSTPAVPITDLPAGRAAITGTMTFTEPDGDTPTLPAVQGAFSELTARLAAHPDRRAAVVLVTDGLPSTCGMGPQDVATAIAMAAAGKPAIPTYAVGVFGAEDQPDGPNALTSWATAGGTGMPFVLTPTADLSQKLLDALNQIRGAALPCEYMIPQSTGGAIDFNKVNLHYQGAGGDEDVGYVGSAAKCDPTRGGWYYDVDPSQGTPTRVEVCAATCNKFKADPNAQVELRLGCKTKVIQ